MFALAILIGIYSYIIFALGLSGFLFPNIIILVTLTFIAISLHYFRAKVALFFKLTGYVRQADFFSKCIMIYIILQAAVNLIGALGPELAFDALWYHLTLPKLYLQKHAVFFIPGGLLYYSAMPKLAEMLYTASLAIHSEILAKCVHFCFGLLTTFALYRLSRMFFDRRISLIVAAVFYSNLVVAWESTTAYVDLIRAFYEILAVWGLSLWIRTKDKIWLIESSVMTGLAITTKLLSLGTLGIIMGVIGLVMYIRHYRPSLIFSSLLIYAAISLLIPLPWFIFSLVNTGNPIYPFFTDIYPVSASGNLFSPITFIADFFAVFTGAADPISPVYILSLPLLFWVYKKFSFEIKILTFLAFLSFLVWYITPRTGGGRFLLPYLPLYSLIVGAILEQIYEMRGYVYRKLRFFIPIILLFLFTVSLFYRGIANSKYLPVILGFQTRDAFLSKNLNFSFGDFYDTDNYFKKTLKPSDRVLTYGFHNLYYVSFPFVDSSFAKTGDRFNYIAVQGNGLPERVKYWDKIYVNQRTQVSVYSLGGQVWHY